MNPYYQDDYVTIYHGDCREIVPTLGRFDLLLTDPPYGIERFKNGIGKGDRMKNKADGGFNNEPPNGALLAAFLAVAPLAIVWGMNNLPLPTTEHFLVWDKEQTVTTSRRRSWHGATCRPRQRCFGSESTGTTIARAVATRPRNRLP